MLNVSVHPATMPRPISLWSTWFDTVNIERTAVSENKMKALEVVETYSHG